MGANISSDMEENVENQNQQHSDVNEDKRERDCLFFPPEILCNVSYYLTPRDKLVAREVCKQWNNFITFNTNLESEVVLGIEDSEEQLTYLANRADITPCRMTNYILHSVELSKKSCNFWTSLNTDFITSLNFSNSGTTENFSIDYLPSTTTSDQDQDQGQKLLCNNLRSLAITRCDKYLMMGNGSTYTEIYKLLNLENLIILDLSNNQYLNDRILFSFLSKTKTLESLNLSNTPMTFATSIFNRFYPGIPFENFKNRQPEDCSDFMLSFQMLFYGFLITSLHLKELIFHGTALNKDTLKKIASLVDQCKFQSLGLRCCNEFKGLHLIEFAMQQKYLKKLELEKNKVITEGLLIELGNYMLNLNHLVLKECPQINSLEFLVRYPNLEYLDLSYCTSIDFGMANTYLSPLIKLTVLKLRGIIPFYNWKNNARRDEISNSLVSTFKKLTRLIELDVGQCGAIINDEVIQVIIRFMPKMRKLSLCKSFVTDYGLASTTTTVIIDGIENLSKLTNLRELKLIDCEFIGNSSWEQVKLIDLRYLDVSGSSMTVERLLEITKNCKSLEVLNVALLRITKYDEQIVVLKKNLPPRLKKFITTSIY